MPEVSVIIPVYQVEKYLSRCLDSILAQTLTDFEILVVDDGSKDQSGSICDDYARKDKRIRVFHTENRGQAAARNLALNWLIANSNSQYITFVDSDDWVHPQYLELLRKAIKMFDANISQCLYIQTDKEHQLEIVTPQIICVSPEEQYIHWYNSICCAKMYARECFESVRFPEGVIYEDIAISYRLLFKQSKIAIVNEVLYYYFTRADSTVNSAWTPKHYSRVNVWEAQRLFFSEFASKELMANVMDRYLSVLCIQLEQVKTSNAISSKTRTSYSRQIRKLIRKYIHTYSELLSPIKNKYLVAGYPTLMKVYWTGKGIKHNLKKRINRIKT